MTSLNSKLVGNYYKLWMIYLINKNTEGLKTNYLTLKSLKIFSWLEEFEIGSDIHEEYEYYNIDIDSIRSFQLFRNRSGIAPITWDLYLELLHMPEKFKCSKVLGVRPNGRKYFKSYSNMKQVSEIYSEDFVINSLYNWPVIRLTGYENEDIK